METPRLGDSSPAGIRGLAQTNAMKLRSGQTLKVEVNGIKLEQSFNFEAGVIMYRWKDIPEKLYTSIDEALKRFD